MLIIVGKQKILEWAMTNSQEIFSIALGLQAPWQISKVAFAKEKSRLDKYLNVLKPKTVIAPISTAQAKA